MWIQFIPGDETFHHCFCCAWALLMSLIFCSVKSAFVLILLSLNLFNRQLYKFLSTYRMTMWCTSPLPYHVTNSSHIIGHFLRYVLFLLQGVFSTSRCVRRVRCMRQARNRADLSRHGHRCVCEIFLFFPSGLLLVTFLPFFLFL